MKADFNNLELAMYDEDGENKLTFTADVTVKVNDYSEDVEGFYAYPCNICSVKVFNIKGIESEGFTLTRENDVFELNGFSILFENVTDVVSSSLTRLQIFSVEIEDDDDLDSDDSAYYNHLTYLECRNY